MTGFVAAGFVHRSSRAGDPQLHTHVLVANLTRCDDSVWRTLHGGPLLWQARTAGYLYKAQLRHELTASLGVAWGPVHKGAAEITGIPAELCALFSTRRHEIQDELDARGEHSPRAARVAALETRQAKDYGVDIGALRDRWHDQALEAGHAPETITAIGQTEPVPITANVEHAATEVLLGAHGLTEQATTFDRRTVLRGWCEQLPAGAPITTIEALADRTLADARVIALQDRNPYPKYSTAELVALEQRLVDRALDAIDTGAGVVAEPHLRGGARRPARTLTRTGRRRRRDHHLGQRDRCHRRRGRDRQDVLARRRRRRVAHTAATTSSGLRSPRPPPRNSKPKPVSHPTPSRSAPSNSPTAPSASTDRPCS